MDQGRQGRGRMKRLEPRKAVGNVVGRIYRHFEQTTGRLPNGEELKQMERKARQAAERADQANR